MAVLEHLEPKRVFSFFEEICAIPHGSGNTKAISDYLVAFARKRGLVCHQDALDNVIIIKNATPGYENSPAVILQGHMDMVCAKAPDCAKDMEREGLDVAVDEESIYAIGTSLGGDDGIAVAMALAILDADDLCHPRLEAVFTSDEETGMYGAFGLDVSPLQGRTMINLDSDMEGLFTVSCAGGNVSTMKLPVTRTPFAGLPVTITVDGLKGGHSGVEIDRGRANANMLLGRILRALEKETPLRLVSVQGGQKDNAIPAEASAVIAVADTGTVQTVCAAMEAVLRDEYRVNDPDIRVDVKPVGGGLPMSKDSTRKVICLLTCAPNGIQTMSADIEGLVQTSLNLGVLTSDAKSVRASFCVRSSVDSQKQMLVDRLESLAAQLGGQLDVAGDYPGWAYLADSPLRDLTVAVFTEQYGHAPKVAAVHAGVECGLFAGKLPGLDCVCIGPDMSDIHTCREKLNIASCQRTWALVIEVLRRMRG